MLVNCSRHQPCWLGLLELQFINIWRPTGFHLCQRHSVRILPIKLEIHHLPTNQLLNQSLSGRMCISLFLSEGLISNPITCNDCTLCYLFIPSPLYHVKAARNLSVLKKKTFSIHLPVFLFISYVKERMLRYCGRKILRELF